MNISQPSPLEESLARIHQRLNPGAPEGAARETIREIIESDGLDRDCPAWLAEWFGAVAQDGSFAARVVARDDFFRKNVAIPDFLAQVADWLGLPFVNEGEFIQMEMDPLNAVLILDFEAGEGVGVRLVRESADGGGAPAPGSMEGR